MRTDLSQAFVRRKRFMGRRSLSYAAVLGAIFALPSSALAHPGQVVTPDELWQAWNWDPVLLLNLAFLAWLYRRGLARIRRRTSSRRAWNGRAAAFAGSLATLYLALASPIDALGETLLTVHMLQHMLLMMVAAPLMMLSSPLRVMLWGLEPPARKCLVRPRQQWRWCQTLAQVSWHPLLLWTLNAGVLWAWHLPQLYEAALENPFVHDLQHLTFFVSAALYWRVLLDPDSRRRLNRGAGVLFLFTTSLHTMALGVLMTLSPVVWYPGYEGRTLAWNLNALQDQQLAGFLMWMPGGMMYALVAAGLLVLWLEEPDRHARHPGRGGLSVCRTGRFNSAKSW